VSCRGIDAVLGVLFARHALEPAVAERIGQTSYELLLRACTTPIRACCVRARRAAG
jgi:hypothetical protein